MSRVKISSPFFRRDIQEQLKQFYITSSPPSLSQPELKDGYCNREFNRNCLGYESGIKVVKENLFSLKPENKYRAMIYLGDLIAEFPSRVYKENPDLVKELCRIAEEDPNINSRIFAHQILSRYFEPGGLPELLLATELVSEKSLIHLIANTFLQSLRDSDSDLYSLAQKENVLNFFRVHPQFIDKVYNIFKDQMVHAKNWDVYHNNYHALKKFNQKEDEYTLSIEQLDQSLLEAYYFNDIDEIKSQIIFHIKSPRVLIDIMMTGPDSENLESIQDRLNNSLRDLSWHESQRLLDPVIESASEAATVIVAFQLKLSQTDNKEKKKETYLQACHHPFLEVSQWAVQNLLENEIIDELNPSELKSLAKKYFNLEDFLPVQLAIPKKIGNQIVTDPETFGTDIRLFKMAYLAIKTFQDPSYQTVLKSLTELRNGKPRTVVLNFERFTLLRKTEEKSYRKHDAAGISLPGKEILYRHTLDRNPDRVSQTLIHELGHALMRAAYPIMPYTLGPMHDERNDHPYDEQTNFSNAWVEGVATAFEYIEEKRLVQNEFKEVPETNDGKPQRTKQIELTQTSTLSRKGDSEETEEVKILLTSIVTINIDGFYFDLHNDDSHKFENYSLFHKRRNENFIGALLATYLAPQGYLNPKRYKAFMDTLSNGGKRNRTQFGVRQFVADFVKEHPEEREAFLEALDKYGMKGLVPKKYLSAQVTIN